MLQGSQTGRPGHKNDKASMAAGWTHDGGVRARRSGVLLLRLALGVPAFFPRLAMKRSWQLRESLAILPSPLFILWTAQAASVMAA